jgi:hypothetical protein
MEGRQRRHGAVPAPGEVHPDQRDLPQRLEQVVAGRARRHMPRQQAGASLPGGQRAARSSRLKTISVMPRISSKPTMRRLLVTNSGRMRSGPLSSRCRCSTCHWPFHSASSALASASAVVRVVSKT